MIAKRNARQTDIVDRAVDALRGEPVPPTPAEAVRATLAADVELTHPIGRVPISRRIWTMNRLTKLAVAAAVIAGAFGAILWATVGGGGATLAWADVQKHLNGLRAMTMNASMQVEGQPPMTMRMMIAADGKMRQEVLTPLQAANIIDLRRGRMLCLTEEDGRRTAVVLDLKGLPTDQLEGIEQMNILKKLGEVSGASVEELGPQDLDGRSVPAYRVVVPNPLGGGDQVHDLWVDPQTGLPVRLETTLGGMGTIVMTDFRFDEDLDPALFSLKAPAGYEVQSLSMDLSDVSLADVAALLDLWTELMGPTFPDAIDAMTMSKAIGAVKGDQLWRGEQGSRFGELYGRVAVLLSQADQARYVGKGVRYGDADTPVFVYRAKEAETYQVLYGDLSIREVAPEDLGEIPAPSDAAGPADDTP